MPRCHRFCHRNISVVGASRLTTLWFLSDIVLSGSSACCANRRGGAVRRAGRGEESEELPHPVRIGVPQGEGDPRAAGSAAR